MSKTKLFLIGYFLPAWLSALLMWGDDRTSASFAAAPPWFAYFKLAMQIGSILVLFVPFQLRSRPSFLGIFLAAGTLFTLMLVDPILEAEYILVSSSVQVCVIAIFLCLASPAARLEDSDIRFLFYMFVVGFVLQIFLFVAFGREPSHTITDVFVRFNGITNDSLAAGLILPLLIPWAVTSRNPELKVMAIMAGSIASGSLFSVIITPVATIIYLLYNRRYRFVAIIVGAMGLVGLYFYDLFSDILSIKFDSILSHMRFFLNLSGVQYEQSTANCSEEFCESFIESGMHLNPAFLVMMLALMACFLLQFVWLARPWGQRTVIYDTLRVLGATLFVASLVHPVPLIPFALPIFLIFASLYRADAQDSVPRLAAPVRV